MSDMIRDDIPEFFCKNWEPATNNGWIRTRKTEAVSLVPAQKSIRPWNRFADEGHG
jgi:hypothetical protein